MTSGGGIPQKVPFNSLVRPRLPDGVYVLNFLDRTLIHILFTPIKKELAFSDLRLALLGSMSFVFSTAARIPFGLADREHAQVHHRVRPRPLEPLLRSHRVRPQASGRSSSAASWWASARRRSALQRSRCSADYFPPRMRATVQSIYSSGIAIGGGLAFFLGGWIGQVPGWRWAFHLLGFPGLLLAVAVFALREQPRGRTESVVEVPTDWRIISARSRFAISTRAMH